MSKKLKNTSYGNWGSPAKGHKICNVTEKLRQLLEEEFYNFDLYSIKHLLSSPLLEYHYSVRTNDGYLWPTSFIYNNPEGRVLVTIPCTCDKKKRDGSKFDRRIAIYIFTTRDVAQGVIAESILEMIRIFRKAFERAQIIRNTT